MESGLLSAYLFNNKMFTHMLDFYQLTVAMDDP